MRGKEIPLNAATVGLSTARVNGSGGFRRFWFELLGFRQKIQSQTAPPAATRLGSARGKRKAVRRLERTDAPVF